MFFKITFVIFEIRSVSLTLKITFVIFKLRKVTEPPKITFVILKLAKVSQKTQKTEFSYASRCFSIISTLVTV